MNKLNRVVEQWHGVAITIIILGLIQLGTTVPPVITITPSVNLAFIPLAYTVYKHGLYPGLAAAVLITLYSYIFLSLPIDLDLQIAITAFVIVSLMGVLKRHSEVVETIGADDNISKVHEISLLTGYLLENRHEMNDGLIYRLLLEIQDRSGNLEAVISGWLQLAAIRQKEERLHQQDIIRKIVKDFEAKDKARRLGHDDQ